MEPGLPYGQGMEILLLADISIPGLNHLPEEIRAEILVQGLRLGSTLLLLLFSWLIGQRIIAYWEIRRRIRESDLESEKTFQRLHGEFKALWRIWKVHTKQTDPDQTITVSIDQPVIWNLLERSSILEGEWEALLLKLASNRKLTPKDLNDLGLLRQLIQQLREGIKRGNRLDEDFRKQDYHLFHKLSARAIEILRQPNQFQNAEKTNQNIEVILAVSPSSLEESRSPTPAKVGIE
jgi:hypothetical protein